MHSETQKSVTVTTVSTPAGVTTTTTTTKYSTPKSNAGSAWAKKLRALQILSVALYIAGIASIISAPQSAHNTYVSENALSPGGTYEQFRGINVAKQVTSSFASYNCSKQLALALHEYGIEARHGSSNGACYVYAVIKAYKGDGEESIVLSSRILPVSGTVGGQISGLGLAVAIAQHVQTREQGQYLAKDIVLVFTDNYAGVEAWLYDLYQGHLPVHGAIQAAISLEMPPMPSFSKIMVGLHGANGQLPNLDLVNTFARTANNEGLGGVLRVKQGLASRHSLFRYLTTQAEFLSDSLFSFVVDQAFGVPTGAHAAFLRYNIDAITIAPQRQANGYSIESLATAIIGTIRSLNNLLEKLHQSFFYYLLPSVWSYLSIGEYMISLGLLASPLAVRIVLPLLHLKNDDGLVRAAVMVVLPHILGTLLYVAPSSQPQLFSNLDILTLSIGYSILAGIGFLVMGTVVGRKDYATTMAPLNVLSLLPFVVFVSACSLTNFSFAALVTLVITPIYVWILVLDKNFVQRVVQFGILVLLSPPSLIYGLSVALNISTQELVSSILTSHSSYGTMTWQFLALVYCPLHILFLKLIAKV